MFSSTITLKDVADASHSFVQIDSNGQPGTLRIDTSLVTPERGELMIRHQEAGSGLNKGWRHTVTLVRRVADTAGNVRQLPVNISLVVPDHSSVSSAIVYDTLKEALDFFISTATFALDTSNVDSLLRRES